MRDLRKLRFVTVHYAQLQGLRLIPLAIPFLLSALWRSGRLAWVPGIEHGGAARWFALLMVLALLAARRLGRHYRENYGHIQPSRRIGPPLLWTLFGMAYVGACLIQTTVQWSISLPALVIAAGLAEVGTADGYTRPHYLFLAAIGAVFACLPLVGVPYGTRNTLLDGLMALGFLIAGLGDHVVLRRTLRPVRHVCAF